MSAPIVFIVGTGDYIGAAIARRFAEGGFTVCMGRRNGHKLEPLVNELRGMGGKAYGYTHDARDEEKTEAIFKEIETNVGPIDREIFNVGGNVYFPLMETTARVFRKVWEMACFAGFFTGREAARYMVPRGRGKIFFTGASASMRGKPGYSAFSAGKAGLRMLAQSMAREFGPQNIHVAHLIIDAGVDTAFVRERIAASGKNPDDLPPDTLMSPRSVAESYWVLYHQTRDGWTHELDLRPYGETW